MIFIDPQEFQNFQLWYKDDPRKLQYYPANDYFLPDTGENITDKNFRKSLQQLHDGG